MVLDLHCDFEAVEHLYTTPDAWPQIEPLARYLGVQASLLATDSGGQSFDECFSLVWWQLQQRFGKRFPIPLGCCSVTVELRGQADVSHDLASKDCQAILDFLTHAGVIEGTSAPCPRCYATPPRWLRWNLWQRHWAGCWFTTPNRASTWRPAN